MEFDRLLQRIIEEKIEFILVGGFAAIVHGAVVVTQDVDVCLNFSRDNLLRLAAALSHLHPFHRITPGEVPFEINDTNWSSLKNLYLKTDCGILDCLGEVSGIGNYQRALPNSTFIDLPIGTCRVLTIEALIRAKEAMARPHDLRTVTALKAILGRRKQNEQ